MNHDSTERWADALGEVAWRKSSFSTSGECVSFAEVGHEVALRNSNNPEAGTLFFKRRELAGLIAGAKVGEFDDLTA